MYVYFTKFYLVGFLFGRNAGEGIAQDIRLEGGEGAFQITRNNLEQPYVL